MDYSLRFDPRSIETSSLVTRAALALDNLRNDKECDLSVVDKLVKSLESLFVNKGEEKILLSSGVVLAFHRPLEDYYGVKLDRVHDVAERIEQVTQEITGVSGLSRIEIGRLVNFCCNLHRSLSGYLENPLDEKHSHKRYLVHA